MADFISARVGKEALTAGISIRNLCGQTKKAFPPLMPFGLQELEQVHGSVFKGMSNQRIPIVCPDRLINFPRYAGIPSHISINYPTIQSRLQSGFKD